MKDKVEQAMGKEKGVEIGKEEVEMRRYKNLYLINPWYGGYDYTEESSDKPTQVAVDYASPAEVISIAEREGLSEVSLAGGFWERIGYEGYGERIPVSEARKVLAKRERR